MGASYMYVEVTLRYKAIYPVPTTFMQYPPKLELRSYSMKQDTSNQPQ